MEHRDHIPSKLASHPQFIALVYQLIENAIKDSKIPNHTCGIIGGAAGILHHYHHSDLNKTIKSLNKNTRTTDIDLALWYHTRLQLSDFIQHTEMIEKHISTKFSEEPLLGEWKQIVEDILGESIDFVFNPFDITCTIQKMGRYAEMTGKINIVFTIFGKNIELVELVIHNMLYSQDRNPDFTQRLTERVVTDDVTYLDNNNTEIIKVIYYEDYYTEVTVPTIDRLLQQLYFVYGNKYLDGKLNHDGSDDKYMGRIEYLLSYASDDCILKLLDMQKSLFNEIGYTLELLRKRNKHVSFPMVKYLEPLIQQTISPRLKSPKSASKHGLPPLHPHSSHKSHSAVYHGSSKKGGSKPRSGDSKPRSGDSKPQSGDSKPRSGDSKHSTRKPKRILNRTRKR